MQPQAICSVPVQVIRTLSPATPPGVLTQTQRPELGSQQHCHSNISNRVVCKKHPWAGKSTSMVLDESPRPGSTRVGRQVPAAQCSVLPPLLGLEDLENSLLTDWVESERSWYNSSRTGQHQGLLRKVQRCRPSHRTPDIKQESAQPQSPN